MNNRTDCLDRLYIAAGQTMLATLIALTFVSSPVTLAQQDTEPAAARPSADWSAFKQARYAQRPILVHLRNGFERAILMPEPIRIADGESLPGTAIEIDEDVIGFYPTQVFERQSVSFIGLVSGTVYELRIRASPKGLVQPLRIVR